jgi:glyoxylase-like metal-dependent hydrolase (beta-lactamase superfamily II)
MPQPRFRDSFLNLILPTASRGVVRPNFVDERGRLKGLVQTFLIIIAGHKIIVDPGVGNGKRRVAVPGWDNLQTNFLDRLRATGGELDGIDYVVNTHLHFDHVAGTRS